MCHKNHVCFLFLSDVLFCHLLAEGALGASSCDLLILSCGEEGAVEGGGGNSLM